MTGHELDNAPRAETAAPGVIIDRGPEHRPALARELLRAEAGDVRADQVTMEGSGAEQITAERLVMTNSGARTLEARSAQVERSGILGVKSERAVFNKSTIVGVSTNEARIVGGSVLLLRAGEVNAEGDARIGILAGPGCNAVRPLVDVRGAAAFGAAAGAAVVVLGAIVRRIFRRN